LPGVFDNLNEIPQLSSAVRRSSRQACASTASRRSCRAADRHACDLPIEVELDALHPKAPDLRAVDRFCDAQGFGRMLREQARRIAGGRPRAA
jgi:hypothetical protein